MIYKHTLETKQKYMRHKLKYQMIIAKI